MKTAYSYLRWSTKSQGNTGRDSRARQTESADEWIRDYGNGQYVLSKEVFIDAGKSAFKGKHVEKDEYGKAKGDLERFLQLVEAGTIKKDSILLIDSYDRFSRLPPTKSLTLFMRVIDSGIGLVFTGSQEKRVINTALIDKEGYILQFIIGEMQRSYNESKEKSRKILAAQNTKNAKMQAGEVLKHHCAPKYYSYNKDKQCYEKNDLTPIVTRIINEFLGGSSLYQISNGLNRDKIRSLRYANTQANWSRMAIKSLLQSKCLYGEFLNIPNYFSQPVIDKATFDQVQAMLARNSDNKGRYSTEFINIFRGLAKCSCCKCAMSIGIQSFNYKANKPKAVPYRYMRCSSVSNGKPCENRHNLNLIELEEVFFRDFLLKNPDELINGNDKEAVKTINTEITEKQTQLNKITEKVNALGELAGVITTANLLKQGEALKVEQEKLRADIDNLNLQRSSIIAAPVSRDVLLTITDFDADSTTKVNAGYSLEKIKECLQDNTTRQKIRNALPNLISKIVVDTTKAQFYVFNRSGKQVFESESLHDKRDWQKVVKLSWNPKHKKAMKGKTPQQIKDYAAKLGNTKPKDERLRVK